MGYKFNPFTGNLDDAGSGSGTNYWEANTYGLVDFLQPIDTTQGLLVGNDLHSSVSTAFNTTSAFFNGDIANASQGFNYFVNIGYGSSFFPIGGAFVGGRARGTAAAPTQTLANDYLLTVIGSGYDGSTWAINPAANHFAPGLFIVAATDVAAGVLESDTYIGGLTTRMIGFESNTNNILFNEAQMATGTTTSYWDAGTAWSVDHVTGDMTIGVRVLLPDGTAALPALTWTSDPDTGIHRVGANQMSFDANGLSRMQISATSTVVNPANLASGDFQIHGDTVSNLFQTDASADALSFFNATPVAQSTGWSVTNETTDKSFDADATTVDELADVLGTLIETLKTYGILGG